MIEFYTENDKSREKGRHHPYPVTQVCRDCVDDLSEQFDEAISVSNPVFCFFFFPRVMQEQGVVIFR